VKLIALLFCYKLGLMGIISPYATGPGPIYYGSAYMSRKEFWTLGLIFGVIYLGAILLIGIRYVRFISAGALTAGKNGLATTRAFFLSLTAPTNVKTVGFTFTP
jgi:hypothetical protein